MEEVSQHQWFAEVDLAGHQNQSGDNEEGVQIDYTKDNKVQFVRVYTQGKAYYLKFA